MTKQIMITLQQIKDNDPPPFGWNKVLKANGGKSADFDKPFPVSSILDSNNIEYTFWALRCLPEHDLLWRRYALWCALQVKDNTADPIVHECLKTVERFCNGEATQDELSEARLATWSAAYSAERLAARLAAHAAAYSAGAVVRSGARSAARSAAHSETWSAERAAYSAEQKAKLREVLDTGICALR